MLKIVEFQHAYHSSWVKMLAKLLSVASRVYVRHGRGWADQIFELYYNDLEVGEPLEEWCTAGLDSMGEVEESF